MTFLNVLVGINDIRIAWHKVRTYLRTHALAEMWTWISCLALMRSVIRVSDRVHTIIWVGLCCCQSYRIAAHAQTVGPINYASADKWIKVVMLITTSRPSTRANFTSGAPA